MYNYSLLFLWGNQVSAVIFFVWGYWGWDCLFFSFSETAVRSLCRLSRQPSRQVSPLWHISIACDSRVLSEQHWGLAARSNQEPSLVTTIRKILNLLFLKFKKVSGIMFNGLIYPYSPYSWKFRVTGAFCHNGFSNLDRKCHQESETWSLHRNRCHGGATRHSHPPKKLRILWIIKDSLSHWQKSHGSSRRIE